MKELRIRIYNALRRLNAMPGNSRYCPCCGHYSGYFLPYGNSPFNRRDDVVCPWCGSFERHRLLILHLENHLNILDQPQRVLHFAPEKGLVRQFKRLTKWEYVTADLYFPAMYKEDITVLSFQDNSFDLVICFHVLHNVKEDQKAMQEVWRVLKPGGHALIMSLYDPAADSTREDGDQDVSLTMEGHHVLRIYGRDFPSKLTNAGFSVTVINPAEWLSSEEKTRLGVADKMKSGLLNYTSIFDCVKNAS